MKGGRNFVKEGKQLQKEQSDIAPPGDADCLSSCRAIRAIYRLPFLEPFQVNKRCLLRMLIAVQPKTYIGNLISGDTS
jgi:hypothetical protein